MEITKDNLVEQFRSSGQTQKAFCSQHGIRPKQLQYELYTKSKRAQKKALPVKNISPSFISFSATENLTSNQDSMATQNRVTIIHGTFSIHQIATLLTELNQKC